MPDYNQRKQKVDTQINAENVNIYHPNESIEGKPEKSVRRVNNDNKSLHLPLRKHDHLWGRDREIQELMEVLRNPRGKPLICISGIGGIGKTALTMEVIELCKKERLFRKVLWESAQEEIFVGNSVQRITPSFSSANALLASISRKLGEPTNEQDISSDKQIAKLQSLLIKEKCWVVVDNLETAQDHKSIIEILGHLIPSRSRFIVTSRMQLDEFDYVYSLSLKGLTERDCISFIRQEGKDRGITGVAKADDRYLLSVAKATGGAPLAAKLVVAQLGRLPLEIVLEGLNHAKADYEKLYTFLFLALWKLMTAEARKVLLSMHVFPLPVGRSAIEHVSTVRGNALSAAIAELVSMSLLDVTNHLLNSKKRYTVHQLTRNFIQTELVSGWK